MDIARAQTKLKAKGYYQGEIDGQLGPGTIGALMSAINSKWATHFPDLAKYIWRDCSAVEVNTPLRVCHYLAQAGVETASFTTLKEIGNDAYFARYDYRKDLGNTHPGDGPRYRGRGIFQTTGRYNYEQLGAHLKLDLIDHPELLEAPDGASKSAAYFWKSRSINTIADTDDFKAVSRKINGGLNGIHDREEFTERLKDYFR